MTACRSRKGAWIEILITVVLLAGLIVAPVRERGLKLNPNNDLTNAPQRRSRKGAWIEIGIDNATCIIKSVAPVRERGLKSDNDNRYLCT